MIREPSFLVIANPVREYLPMQLNFLDHEIKGIDFNFGPGTEAYFGCTVVWDGQAVILGGKKEYNQVSFQIIYHLVVAFNHILLNRSA